MPDKLSTKNRNLVGGGFQSPAPQLGDDNDET